jgi:plastocyanin
MKKLIRSESRFIIGIGLLFAILTITNSCSKSTAADMYGTGGTTKGTGGPGTNEVWIQGMAFTPATITVNAGTTITWTNQDAVVHTVTSNTGAFASGSIGNGGTYSFKFNTAGTFPYHCAVHPSMTATVIVN